MIAGLSVLAIVYIYNGHYADNTVRSINKVNRELKELQYEYKTLKSEGGIKQFRLPNRFLF